MTGGLALIALVLSAAAAGRWHPLGPLLLAACSVVGLISNRAMEGPVLWQLTASHGVVAADLAGAAGLLLALLLLVLPTRRP